MGPSRPSEVDWTVVKAIIDAQSHTNASLERYLLAVTHDEFELSEEEIETSLEDAIDDHAQAIDDLRTAKEFLDCEGDDDR